MQTTTKNTLAAITLQDGQAVHMGEGIFALAQWDDRGDVQTVVVTEEDLKALMGYLAGL